MKLAVVEIREPHNESDYNGKTICEAIYNRKVHSEDELKELLVAFGLPKECFWNVRLYPIPEFQEMVNYGDSFDTISFIKIGFEPRLSNKIINHT